MSPVSSRLKARWVFPVDRSPIENGLVEFADGIIVEVRAARPHEEAIDCGDAAILPGLVNAHAHLEFSQLSQPLEPALPFTSWIRSLMAYRRQTFGTDAKAKLTALTNGWREAALSGTTLIGDIATDGWSATAFDGVGPRIVGFRELIGVRTETISRQVELAQQWLSEGATVNTTKHTPIHRSLSPHAPYSVAPDLLKRLVELAKQSGSTVAMHVAETRAELELLWSGTGELAEMLRSFGAWPDAGLPTRMRPLDILKELADAPRALIVHGNYLTDDEIDFVAERPNLAVVYCPRTHEFFQHEPHPWQRLLERHANVALGTDGRGSNPDLSLWNELVFLRNRFMDVSPRKLLELGTLDGARALGLHHNCGSLTIGKRADFAIVSLPQCESASDPHELLFATGQPVIETTIAGDFLQRSQVRSTIE